jgi:hypothetical protein
MLLMKRRSSSPVPAWREWVRDFRKWQGAYGDTLSKAIEICYSSS